MKILIKELGLEELDDIPDLDVSVSGPGYGVSPAESGDGLVLKTQDGASPVEFGQWGAKETATRLALWRKNHAEGCTFLGAFDGARLVGFCLLSSECRKGAMSVFSIFVDRKRRGQGIGSRLLRSAEQHAGRAGAKSLFVTTTLARGGAIEFYRNQGFRIVGLLDRSFDHDDGQVAFRKTVQSPTNRTASH